MKRLTIMAALTTIALSLTVAHAQDWYVGIGAKKMMMDWKQSNLDHAQSADGLSFLVGVRSSHFGAEISVQDNFATFNQHTTGGTRSVSNLSVRGANLDGFVFSHFGETGWFQPFITAGVGYSAGKERTIDRWVTTKTGSDGKSEDTKHKLVTPIFSSSEITWRAGLGVEGRLAKDLSVRFTAEYEPYGLAGHGAGSASFGLHVITAL